MQADVHQSPEDPAAVGLLDLRRDQVAASLLQKRMLPGSPHVHGAYLINYEIRPAADLSGDFVDFVELPEAGLVFIVADVAGHGTAAALLTVLLKSFMCRLQGQALSQPADVLVALNAELLAVNLERHVCALCGLVCPDNHVVLSSAGAYPLPLLSRGRGPAGRMAEPIELSGRALGLFEDERFEQTEISMQPGDRLTILTDGVLDLVELNGLKDKESRLAKAAAEASAADFWRILCAAQDVPRKDDVTRFCLERMN